MLANTGDGFRKKDKLGDDDKEVQVIFEKEFALTEQKCKVQESRLEQDIQGAMEEDENLNRMGSKFTHFGRNWNKE